MKIENVLVNMGEHKLREVFLSETCVETLKALDSGSVEPDRLRQIVLQKVSQCTMLRDKVMRVALIMSLTSKAIEALACDLNIRDRNDNLYTKIVRMTFRRGSESERALFGFFEVALGGNECAEMEVNAAAYPMITVSPSRPLFDHQIAAISDIKDRLAKPGSKVLLHMPTGAGKTRMAMRHVADTLVGDPDSLVIWLAHSEELCEQAIEEFTNTWRDVGSRDIRVCRFYGNHTPNLLADDHKTGLVVAGLAKTYRHAQRHDLFLTTLADRVQLVVMDEAHQAIAETYKFILDSLVEKHGARLLGLSATPGRTWNNRLKDEELAEFFGRSKVTISASESPIDFLIKGGFIAKQRTERLVYKDTLTGDDLAKLGLDVDIPQSVLDKLAGDVARNIVIISKIEELIDRGHTRIIYFATSVSNARDISLTLHVRRHDSFVIDASTPANVRGNAIREYTSDSEVPKIVCNFGVLTAGFDAPRTTAVLIARPTKSLVLYSQMVGRAIRGPRVGGSEECTVATVVDTSLPGFDSMVRSFSNWEDVWD